MYNLRENHREFKKKKKKKLIPKLQQTFRSKEHNVLTEEVNKITLSANDDKKIQLTDSIVTYAYGTNKNTQ